NGVLHELLVALKQLRVLSLSDYRNITVLPNSIGSLPVLKRLNLLDCKELKSISILEEAAARQSLMFLEHLQVEECPELESISLLDLCTPNLSYFEKRVCLSI
ncbi:hypothetical protein HN51_060979, partial [Arachis hypogaea]